MCDSWSIKKSMLIPHVGLLFADVNYAMQTYFMEWPVYYLMLSDVVFGCVGGFTAVIGKLLDFWLTWLTWNFNNFYYENYFLLCNATVYLNFKACMHTYMLRVVIFGNVKNQQVWNFASGIPTKGINNENCNKSICDALLSFLSIPKTVKWWKIKIFSPGQFRLTTLWTP